LCSFSAHLFSNRNTDTSCNNIKRAASGKATCQVATDRNEQYKNGNNLNKICGSWSHPASYPTGARVSFLGVKRPGRESDHSPPSIAEGKEWVELYLHSPNAPS
jgi:hypothetical protein